MTTHAPAYVFSWRWMLADAALFTSVLSAVGAGVGAVTTLGFGASSWWPWSLAGWVLQVVAAWWWHRRVAPLGTWGQRAPRAEP